MSTTTNSDRGRRVRNSGEAGFTLAAVLVALIVISIFIAYTVPRQWSRILQRERDKQTIFVMKQYARAILEFETTHGTAPATLDQLKEARKPRLVRGASAEWADPLTGKVDWVLIPPNTGTAPQGPNLTNPNNTNQTKADPGAGTATDKTSTDASTSTNPTSTDTTGTTGTSPGSAADYVGPFEGVRPRITGKSFLQLNGADRYEQWKYTVTDLKAEQAARALALQFFK